MLILTRKEGELIKIGDDISVRVLELGRGQVKLAFEAPKSTPIHREEIYDKIQAEGNTKTGE